MNFVPFLSDIKAVEAGLSVHDGLHLDVSVSTKSPETAQMLAGLVSQQLRQFPAGTVDEQTAELMRKVQVDSEGERARLTLALSKEELERQIQAAQTNRALAAAAPRPVATVTTIPKEEDRGPKTIKILGLDDGIREIPLPSK
jgi:hypothetical protein